MINKTYPYVYLLSAAWLNILLVENFVGYKRGEIVQYYGNFRYYKTDLMSHKNINKEFNVAQNFDASDGGA